MFQVIDREAGNFIAEFFTEEDALKAIEVYEKEDKETDCYVPNFYEVKPV